MPYLPGGKIPGKSFASGRSSWESCPPSCEEPRPRICKHAERTMGGEPWSRSTHSWLSHVHYTYHFVCDGRATQQLEASTSALSARCVSNNCDGLSSRWVTESKAHQGIAIELVVTEQRFHIMCCWAVEILSVTAPIQDIRHTMARERWM